MPGLPGSSHLTCAGVPLSPQSLPGCIFLVQQVSIKSHFIREASSDLSLNYSPSVKLLLRFIPVPCVANDSSVSI